MSVPSKLRRQLRKLPACYESRAYEIIRALAAREQGVELCRLVGYEQRLATVWLGRRFRMVVRRDPATDTWEPVWSGTHEAYNKLSWARFIPQGVNDEGTL